MSATEKTGSVEREVYRSAGALALGLSLLLGGVAILFLVPVLGAAAGGAFSLLLILGIVTIIAGVVQLIIGVYRCADNIDRIAKALLEDRRG